MGKGPGLKSLADYVNWKVGRQSAQPDISKEWRPPVLPVMYDKPQHNLTSALDADPIINRILYKPKLPGPRALPILGTAGFQFLAGLASGFCLTMVFTCRPLGRKEVRARTRAWAVGLCVVVLQGHSRGVAGEPGRGWAPEGGRGRQVWGCRVAGPSRCSCAGCDALLPPWLLLLQATAVTVHPCSCTAKLGPLLARSHGHTRGMAPASLPWRSRNSTNGRRRVCDAVLCSVGTAAGARSRHVRPCVLPRVRSAPGEQVSGNGSGGEGVQRGELAAGVATLAAAALIPGGCADGREGIAAEASAGAGAGS